MHSFRHEVVYPGGKAVDRTAVSAHTVQRLSLTGATQRPSSAAVLLALTVVMMSAVLMSAVFLTQPAAAAYNTTQFTLTPSIKQAAAHPNLTQTLTADATTADKTGGDDVKTVAIEYARGLLANPLAAPARCNDIQFSADTCPSDSYIGKVSVKWRTSTGTMGSASGSTYVLNTAAGSVGSLGFVVRPLGWNKLKVRASVTLRTGLTGDQGMTIATEALPRTISSSTFTRNITISELSVTLNARTRSGQNGPYLMTNPTGCDTAISTVRVTTYSGATTSRTSAFTPTGCTTVPFNPSADVTLTTPNNLTSGLNASISTPTADATVQNSHVRDARFDLNSGTQLNRTAIDALPALCTSTQLDADACPAGSSIGTVSASTPLVNAALNGGAYLMSRNGNNVEIGLVLRSPGGLGTAVRGFALEIGDANAGLGHVALSFSALPQLPFSSASLNISAQLVRTNCVMGPAQKSITLTGWNGASVTRVGQPQIINCPPPPETTITQAPPAITTDATPSFDFVSDDPTATFNCKIDDGQWEPCVPPFTLPPLVSGPHTFCVRALSTSGYSDPTPPCYSFTVGDWPPMLISITSPVDGSTVNAPTTPLEYTVENASDSVTCSPSNGSTVPLVVGSNTITVNCSDENGSASASVTVTRPSLGFNPSFSQTLTNPIAGTNSGLIWSFSLPAGNEAARLMRVALPAEIGPNYAAFGDDSDKCPAYAAPTPTSTFDPSSCPTQSKIGTVTIASSASGGSTTGDVYLIAKNPIPWLGIATGNGLRLLLVGSTPPVDPLCDPSTSPDGYCPTRVSFSAGNMPNVDGLDATVTIDGPNRMSPSQGLLSGKLFRLPAAGDPTCVSPLTTTATFNGWLGSSATRTDSDPITGCGGA